MQVRYRPSSPTNAQPGPAGPGFPGVSSKTPSEIPTQRTYEEGPNDQSDKEQMAQLYVEQLGFENKAGDAELQEMARYAVMQSIHESQEALTELRDKWARYYELYRGESLFRGSYGDFFVHSPEPFKAIEQIQPRIMRAMFDQDPWFRLRGVNIEDDEAAEMQQALCQAQIAEMKYTKKADAMVRDFLMYGTCAQKTVWHQDRRWVHYPRAQRVDDPENPGYTMIRRRVIQREEMVFNGNMVRPIHLFDLYAPTTANGVDEAQWIADQSSMTSSELIKHGEDGLFLNLNELKGHVGSDHFYYDNESKQRVAYYAGSYDGRDQKNAPHVLRYIVIDWWGLFDIEKNGKLVPCNIVIVEPESRKTVAVIRQNPYWHGKMPYQVARYIKLQDEFFGRGVIDPIARLSYEIDKKRSLGLAAAELEANPMLVADDTANIHDAQFTATPGRVIRAGTAEGVKPLFLPKVSESAFQAEQLVKQDLRETHGITSPLMAAEQRSSTATEHVSDINEANVRILGGIRNFEEELAEPMLEQMTWNNQQFMTKGRIVNVLGPQGLKWKDRYFIKPEKITGQFIVQVIASKRLATMMVMTQQLINLLDRAIPLNQATGFEVIKVRPLLGKIFRDGFGFSDTADFIAVDPEEAGLLSALEEHFMWMSGEVPPVRNEDNHSFHAQAHNKFLQSPQFAELRKNRPQVADEAEAHVAQHGQMFARQQEREFQAMGQAAQRNMLMNAGAGGGGGGESEGGRGFAEAGQDQGSPKLRRDKGEAGMPTSQTDAAKSEGAMSAPQAGAA